MQGANPRPAIWFTLYHSSFGSILKKSPAQSGIFFSRANFW